MYANSVNAFRNSSTLILKFGPATLGLRARLDWLIELSWVIYLFIYLFMNNAKAELSAAANSETGKNLLEVAPTISVQRTKKQPRKGQQLLGWPTVAKKETRILKLQIVIWVSEKEHFSSWDRDLWPMTLTNP